MKSFWWSSSLGSHILLPLMQGVFKKSSLNQNSKKMKMEVKERRDGGGEGRVYF